MNILLSLCALFAVIGNLSNAWVMNMGLQEDLPVMGVIGMGIAVMFTVTPMLVTGLIVQREMSHD